jgi:membrane-associated protein
MQVLTIQYGATMYLIMFIIIFCETGLVITPILPGDTLIFTAAALSAEKGNPLNVNLIAVIMIAAAFSGDVVNYFIGRFIGPKVYRKDYKLISKKKLDKTRSFYKKYGKMTVIYGRFIPVIRTFAPFIAGVSEMESKKFLLYNFIGGLMWVGLYAYSGYFLGNITFVKEHFELCVFGLLILTLIPEVYVVVKTLRQKKSVKK